MTKYFKLGEVAGEYYPVIGPDGEHYRNVARCRDVDSGMTRVYAIITKDVTGKVSVAWSHDDLTDGRMNPYSDLEYDTREGFWAAVQDAARDLAAGRIPPECGEIEIHDLPEFLNAEPDDMGAGLINMDTGERVSWGDLEQPDEIIAAIARRAEESEKGGAE